MTRIQGVILIVTSGSSAYAVAESIRKSSNLIKQCFVVLGPYDIVAIYEATNLQEVGQLVVNDIQKLDGIERTITLPSADVLSEIDFSDEGSSQ